MRSVLLLASLVLAGCQTPCQKLCTRMADYAEECNFSVPDSELDTCIEEQASSDNQGECRRAGDPQTLRSEWSCEDLAVFFRQ